MRRRTSRTAPRASVSVTAAADRRAVRCVTALSLPASLTDAFAATLAAAGPFEPEPVLAVAVSGGADSMALAVLAADWARKGRGTVVALTVDHGLRRESAMEARLVGRRLAALGIAHRILRWGGRKPATGIQAAARAARYDLLTGWCRRRGVLHLLTAHHADDQAETLAMRMAHGSGARGLAAMALAVERDGVRLLRPLLGNRRLALRALLEGRDIAWVEDPSTEEERFERIRHRRRLAAAGDATTVRAIARAAAMGARRMRHDDAVADLLAAVQPMPEGWLRMPPDLFARRSAAIARAALERCLMCIGGADYPPRAERLDRLLEALRRPETFAGRTLAGCRIFRWRGGLVVCREAAAIDPAAAVAREKKTVLWDGRIDVKAPFARSGQAIRPLGGAGPRPATLARAGRASDLPGAVLAGLPALCDRQGRPVSVPHLGWQKAAGPALAIVGWRPRHPLAPTRFLALGESCFNGIADYLE